MGPSQRRRCPGVGRKKNIFPVFPRPDSFFGLIWCFYMRKQYKKLGRSRKNGFFFFALFLFGFPNLKQKWPLVPGVMPHPGDPGVVAMPGVCPTPGLLGARAPGVCPTPGQNARGRCPGSPDPPPGQGRWTSHMTNRDHCDVCVFAFSLHTTTLPPPEAASASTSSGQATAHRQP